MVVFLNDILHVQGLQISFPILNKFVNVELRVFNKEEDETSRRDLWTLQLLWESRPLGVLTLRREAVIQKLEANKRNKLKAKGISQGNDLHGQGPG